MSPFAGNELHLFSFFLLFNTFNNVPVVPAISACQPLDFICRDSEADNEIYPIDFLVVCVMERSSRSYELNFAVTPDPGKANQEEMTKSFC